jgi:hypothetical protein
MALRAMLATANTADAFSASADAHNDDVGG